VVGVGLVGLAGGEAGDCAVESVTPPEIAADRRRFPFGLIAAARKRPTKRKRGCRFQVSRALLVATSKTVAGARDRPPIRRNHARTAARS
jgi:hypothetical protein